MILPVLLALALLPRAHSAWVGAGSSCMLNATRLDSSDHRLMTHCDSTTYCAAANTTTTTASSPSGSGDPGVGTCVPRKCRSDEFPFGYAVNASGAQLPPLCTPRTEFCPDDGGGCREVMGVGSVCQLDRDEQCAAQPGVNLGGSGGTGSVCLSEKCMYKNATAGASCALENTTYVEDSVSGSVTLNILRDNCRLGLYCSPWGYACNRVLDVGAPCSFDNQCQSHNCGNSGTCENAPGGPVAVPAWQYIVTVMLIVAVLVATCLCLILLHKRHRMEREREVREWFYEQLSLRQCIIALHASAMGVVDEKGGEKEEAEGFLNDPDNAMRQI
ncbi:hypothetical protein CONPUDRAFT_49932 [Coniophora puteana RWD-64-598 SS2]|uniref:Uncharacterized protein n=1 Tax=Coniophora puteana (strain RWD-64-598) TaxID=741705 RepID=A0A5M3N0F5_CONPW|nr:uncharacterized protein CONPUDRAFT_49932 [Coniophora puteana RWD-64-598 SS2]EIW84524.1 hypothetical protein CONPUDRAFT_49932 [Coniophora puteana RWD-64-598 SS2]